MSGTAHIHFDNSFLNLGEAFYHRQSPEPVSQPAPIRINRVLAAELGIDPDYLATDEAIAAFAGNGQFNGSQPLATVYAGHQFGGWNPQLGDGRALLLGEVITPDGKRVDLQLKGSGRTPYSRGGDGKSPLGPVLREYIVSEAMAALGVPTTRALAAVTTGDMVFREQGALPGAVLARVAQSHLRVGTIQYFAARQDLNSLRTLVDYTLQRHYPQLADSDCPALALLEGVVNRQAELIARWQGIGFIHGVMNTDNMLLCGETVDYGPCAFMEEYHPGTVFSSIDHQGRYAYGNQPAIAQWNLAQLAQALLPLIHAEPKEAVELAQPLISAYPDLYLAASANILAAKLGLSNPDDDDAQLYLELLEIMDTQRADFTLCFRRLRELADPEHGDDSVQTLFDFDHHYSGWLEKWRTRLARDTGSAVHRNTLMSQANPVFIPRNHLVEEAIQDAQQDGDFSTFHSLVEVLADPFAYRRDLQRYAMPAKAGERVTRTFCGT